MRGAALHDVLYAFFLSCQANFFHFTLKLCFTFPAKLYIINAKRSKSKFFQSLCVCDNNKTLLSENFIQSNIFQRSIPYGRSGSKILSLLAKNARMPVKEIAEQVSLTSPAVSSRIHKLETDGIISGYTVTLNRPADRVYVDALISLSVAPSKQDAFLELLQNSKEVLQCYHVTGAYTFLVKVSCGSMPQLEHLILQFQKLGTTSTQIILSTPVNHGELDALML